ncbi:MAG: PEP-CTERM sorting domain-containing protein [Verrucomicrobia bacterium]|nr:MAG: PEP-CTERM sorting domain-containing protein [Verrucomicrobiota bacterium]
MTFPQRKVILRALLLCSLATLPLRAALYSNYVNTAIPDGNLSGLNDVINVSGWTGGNDLEVKLNIDVSGGWNGDLYAYITHGDGFVVLLNRTGRGLTTSGSTSFGYSDTGLNITFATGGSDVHWYQNNSPSYNGSGQLTGTWDVDGRSISPLSSRASFDANGSTNLMAFNGTDPNGNWTIFFADVVSGQQATLKGWSLELTPVPEPVNVALGLFGVALGCVGLCRRRWSRRVGHT